MELTVLSATSDKNRPLLLGDEDFEGMKAMK